MDILRMDQKQLDEKFFSEIDLDTLKVNFERNVMSVIVGKIFSRKRDKIYVPKEKIFYKYQDFFTFFYVIELYCKQSP